MDVASALTQATTHHQAGRLPQAEALYRRILAASPGQPDALHLLGVLAHQVGRHAEGETLIRKAIAQAPQATAFRTSLGHVLRALNRAAEAEEQYRAVARAQPNAPEHHHNLGMARRDLGRVAEAEAAFRQAIRLNRDFVPARLDLGNLLVESGRAKEAEACLRAALRVAPRDVFVLNALGLALVGQAQHEAALAQFDAALALAPGYHNAAVNRANCLTALERFGEAADAYAAVISGAPDDAELRVAQARVLMRLERGAEAEAALQAALARVPEHATALHDMARAYAARDRADLALSTMRKVVRLAPDNADAWHEMGLAYRDVGDWKAALSPLAEAARLKPDNADMRSSYAYGLLANGDFENGWREFAWRVKKPGNVRLREPEWDGAATQQTVIIHAEQGVGDTLQFARFIPLAGERARVVVACPPSLKTLLETLPHVAEVAVDKPVPRYDLHCPLMSLPAILGIGVERFAESVPYVRADAARVDVWRERLAPLPGPRVGVAWAGNPVYPADRKRSIPFGVLAPLLALKGVSFVSLQMGEAAVAGQGCFAFDAAPMIEDYADTAALMMALDLVISVDTSAAHLAGALGRPVWLLNRADTDWRWLLERHDTPWYPTMRIFRQPTPGDWISVVSKVMGVWGLEAPAGS